MEQKVRKSHVSWEVGKKERLLCLTISPSDIEKKKPEARRILLILHSAPGERYCPYKEPIFLSDTNSN